MFTCECFDCGKAFTSHFEDVAACGECATLRREQRAKERAAKEKPTPPFPRKKFMTTEQEISADILKRLDRDFERALFGGYPRETIATTLRLRERCPKCGPILCCIDHMSI